MSSYGKGLPSWFSPHRKPHAPPKPSKTIHSNQIIHQFSSTYPTKEELVELVEKYGSDEYNWSCEVEYSGYDRDAAWYSETPTLEIRIRGNNNNIPNPKYDEQYAAYKIKYKEYREKLAQWKVYKAKYEEQQTEKKRQRDLKMLARLKEQYES